MNLTNMRRCNGLIGPVIATVMCLVGCSRNPVSDAAGTPVAMNPGQEEAKRALLWERIMVPVTNTRSTVIRFRRNSPPPWLDGNSLTFYFRKSAVTEQEEWASWQVVNIHTENFGEIKRRLGMGDIEASVLHTRKSPMRIQPTDALERTAILDEGYAVITDSRIPQQWLLKEPLHLDQKTGKEIRAAYPRSFRASD